MRAMLFDHSARSESDAALVVRCLDGDDAAWHALIGRYARLVEAVIRRYHLPADEQADVFQDVWVALWRDLAAVRQHERLGPWLVTAAGRMAWDARKRLARTASGESIDQMLEAIVDEGADPEAQAARFETSERVHEALARVSPRTRLLIQALFFGGATSYADIATLLGCSPNSVGPIRARCFKELRDALTDR